jgi:hypothetical protein
VSAKRWLLLINFALGFYNVGAIWLTHSLIYPTWELVGAGEINAVRTEHWQRLPGVVFLPAGLALLGSLAMIWLRPEGVPRWAVWLGLALQVAAGAVTASWFAPLQARMSTREGGLALPVYHQLMDTHWIRVAIITAYAILMFWMADKSAWSGSRAKPIVAA